MGLTQVIVKPLLLPHGILNALPGIPLRSQSQSTKWGLTYNYEVDWNYDGNTFKGDGKIYTAVDGDVSHKYSKPGIYTIAILGDFPRIFFDESLDARKILSVDQWGSQVWSSMGNAFSGCTALNGASVDVPNLTKVTNMSSMFRGALKFNQPLNDWDVSRVLIMGGMFEGAKSFNQPLNDWDVSKVVSMKSMFYGATSFNQPLNDWDVSKVTDMSWMFRDAISFNGSLNDWDVSKVTDMPTMFSGATSFNQSLNDWDVSKVTDISRMFKDAISFNGSLNDWDVSEVTDMHAVFNGATSFNQPLNDWDVSKVTHMSWMFFGATSFNQSLNDWNVSKVIDMSWMFIDAISFNGSLNDWDVSQVAYVNRMFYGASSFNQPLNDWDVSEFKRMKEMFWNATSFNQPLNDWDVSSVFIMEAMFYGASSFNQPLNDWDMSGVGNMVVMFANASSFDQSLASWKLENSPKIHGLLSHTGLSISNYDETLIAWQEQEGWKNAPVRDLTLGAHGLKYCKAKKQRGILTNELNWTIYDQVDPNCGLDTLDYLDVRLSPNPSTGLINIGISEQGKGKVTVLDMLGRQIRQRSFDGNFVIDLSFLPNGVYLISIVTKGVTFNKKVILRK